MATTAAAVRDLSATVAVAQSTSNEAGRQSHVSRSSKSIRTCASFLLETEPEVTELTVCRFLMAQRPLSSQPRLESRIGAKTTTKKTKYVEEPLPATLKAELTARVDGWQASLPATAAAF